MPETNARESFQRNFLRLMEQKHIDQTDIAKTLHITASTVSDWTKGKKYPRVDAMQRLADFFGVRISVLTDENVVQSIFELPSIMPIPQTRSIPLLGSIACGKPTMAEENLEGRVAMPPLVKADFALRCHGDSMIGARILDGDIVYIHQQSMVENGQIAAVLIGSETTLKRVYYTEGERLLLMPDNADYAPLIFTGEEMNDVKILGLAVHFTSEVRHHHNLRQGG